MSTRPKSTIGNAFASVGIKSRGTINAEKAEKDKQDKIMKERFANPPQISPDYIKEQAAAIEEKRQVMLRKHDPGCCERAAANLEYATEWITSLLYKLTQANNHKPDGDKTKTDGGKKSRKSHNSKKSRKSKRSRTTYKRSRR